MAVGDYHSLFFVAAFLALVLLSVVFIAPLAILQIIKACRPNFQVANVVMYIMVASACVSCLFFCGMIILISVFSFIPYYASALLVTAFLIALVLAFRPWRPMWTSDRKNWILIALIVLMFVAGWIVAASTRDICITDSPVSISVYLSRKSRGDYCATYGNKPCHVYLTFNTYANESVIVHFHTSVFYKVPVAYYGDTVSTLQTQNGTGIQMDLEVTRYVYYVELTGLTPDTTYYVRVGDGVDASTMTNDPIKFRTAPTNGDFAFIQGGDLGYSATATALINGAAQKEPLYMALGGDLAYANSMSTCYQRWDDWLNMYITNAITPTNYTVPIVASIGNHENGGFQFPMTHIKFFTRYFVQQPLAGTLPQDLPTYHVNYIANQVMLSLDSNVFASPTSQQSFINSTIGSLPTGSWKTAMYHAPAYPSYRPVTDPDSEAVRAGFVPSFDGNSLSVAFENHDHAYKRTYRLKGGNQDATGTLYVGDGAMGVSSRLSANPGVPSNKPYLEVRYGKSFYLLMTVNATAYAGEAYDPQGNLFDSFSNSYP